MNERLREEYYLVKFKILQEEYYTFWYTDDIDGFLLDKNGKLKFFLTKEEAIFFAKEKGFLLNTKDAEEVLVSSEILKKENIRRINCNFFLNNWNTLSDVAHSINCQFIGDSKGRVIRNIYIKLFYGCNILLEEGDEYYRPKWSKKERYWITKVMKNGFEILAKGLNIKMEL